MTDEQRLKLISIDDKMRKVIDDAWADQGWMPPTMVEDIAQGQREILRLIGEILGHRCQGRSTPPPPPAPAASNQEAGSSQPRHRTRTEVIDQALSAERRLEHHLQ